MTPKEKGGKPGTGRDSGADTLFNQSNRQIERVSRSADPGGVTGGGSPLAKSSGQTADTSLESKASAPTMSDGVAVANLRTEIEASKSHTVRWVVGGALTLMAVWYGIVYQQTRDVKADLQTSIEEVRDRVLERIDRVDETLDDHEDRLRSLERPVQPLPTPPQPAPTGTR